MVKFLFAIVTPRLFCQRNFGHNTFIILALIGIILNRDKYLNVALFKILFQLFSMSVRTNVFTRTLGFYSCMSGKCEQQVACKITRVVSYVALKVEF